MNENDRNDRDIPGGETPEAPVGVFSPAAPDSPAPETPVSPEEPTRSAEGFTDASFIPQSQAPRTPRCYAYAGSEMRENRQRWEEEERKSEKKKRRRGMGAGGVIALCLVFLLLGAGGGWYLSGGFTALRDRLFAPQQIVAATPAPTAQPEAAEPTPTAEPEPTAAPEETAPARTDSGKPILTPSQETGELLAATEIYQMACRQVVGISTQVTYNTQYGTQSGTVTGSGFILSEDGYILTNYHVIQYAAEGGYPITVMMYNGDSYSAEIVGYEDDDSDVAVLKIEASGLESVKLGASGNLLVGETIYAVGNPLGELDYTMTKGMVSAMDREISTTDSSGVKTTVNMFQIDAAVNSGNSGGPVYNSSGEVIGIVTAKYSDSYAEMGIEGLGFAIPIDDAVDIANDLIENGYVRGKAYLGINTKSVSSAAAQYYNMVEGAYVYAVVQGSCAETAGLHMGDIITALDKIPVSSSADLQAALKNYVAGDRATISVYRSGERLELPVVFDERQPETETAAAPSTGNNAPGANYGYSGGLPW